MRKIAGLVLFFSTLVVHAQTAYVIKSVQGPALLRPDSLVSAGQWLYFLAWDGVRTEDGSPVKSLWRTDGTPEGTVELMPTPGGLRAVGNWLFFGNSEKPGELWITDGTPSGTRRVTEILTRFPEKATIRFVLGDTLFVAVGHSSELWTTKIAPGSPAVRLGVEGSAGDPLLEANGRVLFLAGETREELVASDGTSEGTYTLGTLPDGGLDRLAVMAGHFYIFREGGDGISLWRTDGTPEGTVRIAPVPGTPSKLVVAGRNLFFVVSGKLWVSDGTAAGTRELPAEPLETIAVAGDRVVFRGSPVPKALTGSELWVSDGTPEGTFLLRDIYRGLPESYLSNLTSVGPLVYFAASSLEDGRELWVTDGTAEGTKIAADLSTHQTSSNPDQITRAGERVFFTAIKLGSPVVELWALPLPGPPRLAIEAALVSEGAAARFRVTLSRAASEPVTVGYETADGTATAGADYDPRSGTLTFAPGETSGTIEIPGRDDAAVEPHETFSVTLRDAAGAALPTHPAFAFIEDGDRTADVALTLDLSKETSFPVVIQTANHGPYAAHSVRYSKTVTPVQSFAAPCSTRCIGLAGVLATGQTARESGFGETDGRQHYFTWTVGAHERDPNPGNNTIGWTTAPNMAMNALYLTPGQEATVWYYPGQPGAAVKMESSEPRVVAVPATLATVPGKLATTFAVRALADGKTTLRVAPDTWMEGTLDIFVVAPGAKMRWPSQVFAERVGEYCGSTSRPRFGSSPSARPRSTAGWPPVW
jgi:ELWxxDGT repeat protein